MTQLLPVPGRNAEGLAKVGTLGLLFAEWVELHPVEKGGRKNPGKGGRKCRSTEDYIQIIYRINCLYRM